MLHCGISAALAAPTMELKQMSYIAVRPASKPLPTKVTWRSTKSMSTVPRGCSPATAARRPSRGRRTWSVTKDRCACSEFTYCYWYDIMLNGSNPIFCLCRASGPRTQQPAVRLLRLRKVAQLQNGPGAASEDAHGHEAFRVPRLSGQVHPEFCAQNASQVQR